VLVGLAHPAAELDLHSDQKYGQNRDRPQNPQPKFVAKPALFRYLRL
jgi:hypothetical protein